MAAADGSAHRAEAPEGRRERKRIDSGKDKFVNKGAKKLETAVHALGCKVNYADTQALYRRLVAAGAPPAALVGTCCVTAEAEKHSRKQVRRAARRVGPGSSVFVAGCAARFNPGAFERLADNVVVVTGDPAEAMGGPGAERKSIAGEGALAADEAMTVQLRAGGGLEAGRDSDAGEVYGARRIRAFIKVQDGCSNRCAYCVIPQVRGEPWSLDAGEILARARATVEAGIPELVLTGINLGAYGSEIYSLADLVHSLAAIDGLGRLRLSSIEIEDVTPRLLRALEVNSKVVGPHLHVPLQSGDDGVLKAMGRRYDSGVFKEKAEWLRNTLPGLNLTTDVIIGFPGEGEPAFDNTMSLVDEIGFSKVHVFPYSPRSGTRAYNLGDPVPPAQKKERCRRLRMFSRRLGDNHRRRKLGQVSEVLLESVNASGYCEGYSSDYTRYRVKTGDGNRFSRVVGLALDEGAVRGELVADGQ
jgi:threonylcarbamoyladenosine tRNA methylthiotransferase MtaB